MNGQRFRRVVCVVGLACSALGCASPYSPLIDSPERRADRARPAGATAAPPSTLREGADVEPPTLDEHASATDYVLFAALNNPGLEAAYQRWRAAAERIPQAAAPPDPRITFGVFIEEIETRTGPQEARFGVTQTIPWPGRLADRTDAASRGAMVQWRRFESARLALRERVLAELHELRYLDRAIAVTDENIALLRQFEEVVRARYRVGAGQHAEVIRVQVELGLLEDRARRLAQLRPALVAGVNAALNRPPATPIPAAPGFDDEPVTLDPDAIVARAVERNPGLLALDEEREMQSRLADAARKEGYPDLTVGLEYIFTGEAVNPATPGSGDDPVLLTFSINLPIWRARVDAGVREAVARRLAVSHERADESNRIAAAVHRAWFDHTDAERRVRLYEETLIPKADESLRASLAAFRAGDASFLDLLETERTLLEFALAVERARADRGIARARLESLAGGSIDAADSSTPQTQSTEVAR